MRERMLKRRFPRRPTTCGVRHSNDGFVHMPHAPRRTLFSVLCLSQGMPSQLLTNAWMLSPQIVSHGQCCQPVPDGDVPPGEVTEQRLGQQSDEDVEPDLEEAESHDHEKQRRGRILDLGGEGGGDTAHDHEGADVYHRVPEDAGWLDDDVLRACRSPKYRTPEHGGREQRLAVDEVHDEKPDRDGRRPDAPGDEALAQNAIQVHGGSIYRRAECVLEI